MLRDCGAQIHNTQNHIRMICDKRLKNTDIQTMPYPGFPTDVQSQAVSAMATMEGTGIVKETIFENRFKHTAELLKMGADITISERIAIVRGVNRLTGAHVYSPDLRGGAALVLAALGAEGSSIIDNIHYIERGYDHFDSMLSSLGADIKRTDEHAIP